VIRFDERQGQVDAARYPGRTPDVVICDEDPICVDIDRGVIPLQPVGHSPMRRRASSVAEVRFGEQEGASADTGDPRHSAGETRDGLHFAGFQHG
jgi:hypothetical protein